jgi:hypothetical protein
MYTVKTGSNPVLASKLNNMNKKFIPYEQALELKELGFDEECLGYYHTTLSSSDVDLVLGKTHNRFYHLVGIPEDFNTLAPLYQQAFKFLREMIITRISDESSYLEGQFTLLPLIYFNGYEIHVTPEPTSFTSSINHNFIPLYEFPSKRKIYKETTLNYDDAQLACLKRMVQIVKNK